MAACFKNGDIHLVRSYDDVIPQVSSSFFLEKKRIIKGTWKGFVHRKFGLGKVSGAQKKYEDGVPNCLRISK